jgi:hypothetical protein
LTCGGRLKPWLSRLVIARARWEADMGTVTPSSVVYQTFPAGGGYDGNDEAFGWRDRILDSCCPATATAEGTKR